MGNKPKLYIKNDKGRYEEYKPEMKTDDDGLLFRKVGKKYIPCERYYFNDSLSEGVWVVLSNLSYCRKRIASGDYLKELFQIQKVSGIEEPTLAQLGGLSKCADYVIKEWNEYYRHYMLGHEWNPNNHDVIYFIIGKVFEYCNKVNATKKGDAQSEKTESHF